MANICMYKIKVIGRQQACYAFIDMMPSYSYEKEILEESGTEDNYELILKGDCKWSVSSYTSPMSNPMPFTQEELDAVQDGDHWDKTLRDKSVLLDCEIFCNSKDIDDSCWAIYEHYDKGKVIHDECPKELHIKRGRDYDTGCDIVIPLSSVTGTHNHYGTLCKVKLQGGTYWYVGEYEINDIVTVDGAKKGLMGIVTEVDKDRSTSGYLKILEKVGHVSEFKENEVELIWKSYKPAARKEYLLRIGLETEITKKKFLTLMYWKWVEYCVKNDNWEEFLKSIE